jgi:hypothetical protein
VRSLGGQGTAAAVEEREGDDGQALRHCDPLFENSFQSVQQGQWQGQQQTRDPVWKQRSITQ